MTDIVERLRNWERVDIVDAHEDGALYNAAADEIERLRKENGRLDSNNKELLYDNEQKYAEIKRLLDALKTIAATADWKTQLTISNDALEGK
jgi:predicted nuclease with TOPRIM domain